MTFNRLFRSKYSRPIYRRDDFDSNSDSDFDFIFDLYRKLVEKWQLSTKNDNFDQIWPNFDIILITFDHFWLFNRHLVDLNRSFNQKYIENDQI